ncbi:MAG: RluA family pseudouridine synthase, partial [Candidatus Omnitrophota bacterium]
VHPAVGNLSGTLVNALLFHTKGNLSHMDSPRPGIVHRLDKDVSGLMVAAKTDFAHKFFVEQFKERSVKRDYIAFVNGIVIKDAGEVSLPIGRSVRDRKKMAVKFFNSKEAFTVYRVEKRFRDYTKMKISLMTGRTHQIRVHLSHIGHPIIGDTKYGGKRFERIALYAERLSFIHPRTQKKMVFEVGLPEELKELENQ